MNKKEHEFFLFQIGHGKGDKFLSDVVHKIKNNLGGISGFASLLERDLRPNDPRKKLLHRIIDGVHHLNEFVIHLMSLVQEVEPSFEKVRIKPLLKEVCQSIFEKEKNGNEFSTIVTDFPSETIELSADPHLIREFFFHILHFVQLVGGKMDTIKVHSVQNGKIDIEINFSDGHVPSGKTDDIVQFIEDCEPVEARLSLAVAFKIADLHHACVSINKISQSPQVLLIQLVKGN